VVHFKVISWHSPTRTITISSNAVDIEPNASEKQNRYTSLPDYETQTLLSSFFIFVWFPMEIDMDEAYVYRSLLSARWRNVPYI
jgi:hypothetical protein